VGACQYLRPLVHHTAFLWTDGVVTLIPPLPVPPGFLRGETVAVAVNDRTQVALTMYFAVSHESINQVTAVWSAHLWSEGEYAPLPRPVPHCREWVALDLNNSGHVAVNCSSHGSVVGTHLWNLTTYIDLDPLGAVIDLNDRDEVLGRGPDNVLYLWRNGEAFPVLDRQIATSARLDNHGRIVLSVGGSGYLLVPN
jgi:hypothetical protein